MLRSQEENERKITTNVCLWKIASKIKAKEIGEKKKMRNVRFICYFSLVFVRSIIFLFFSAILFHLKQTRQRKKKKAREKKCTLGSRRARIR